MIRQRPIVFATPAYRYVAEAIMHRGFGVPGGLERKEFPDGDAFARIIATGLLDGLACTDMHPNVLGLPSERIQVESIAGMLTDYLKGSL